MKLTKIFEPITISKTEFKNRMVVSAMVTNYCNEDGTPTDFAVTRTAGASKTLAGLWEDRQIEPLRQLGGTVRQGTKAV